MYMLQIRSFQIVQFFLSLHISEVTTNSPELVVIMNGEFVQSCLQSGCTEEGWVSFTISLANAMLIGIKTSVVWLMIALMIALEIYPLRRETNVIIKCQTD